ncbi:MAG: fructose-bisphosphatase class III, partial [Lachnospiraceae bacterium]|nr:fructose-bisphosphatase class III [Lachnospiraceae bacterium]
MSTYVISDIHGQYKSFLKMLDLIRFGEDDVLYCLGDVIDRGPDGIKIIQYMMKHDNIELFMGNHELLMLDALKNEYEIQNKNRLDTDDIDIWLDPCNGGLPTYNAF